MKRIKKTKKDQELDNLSYGAEVALKGLSEYLFLAIIKAAVGLMTGMIVLVADALSSCSDMLTIFASYLGLRISKKTATREFSYGYYKVETLAALIVSLTILYLGFVIFFESLGRFHQAETPSQNQWMGIIAVLVSFGVSYQLAHMFRNAAEKTNSLSLLNSSKDATADMYVQIAVLMGVAGNYFHIPYIEGTAGMIISFMTIKVGFDASKESLFYLLDYFDDRELIKKVESVIRHQSKVIEDVNNIKMRRAGTFIFGEAIVQVSPYVDAKDIRTELMKLKESIGKLNPYLKNFSILVSIPHPRKIKIAVAVKEDRGLHSPVAESLEETKYYVFVTVKKGKITGCYARTFKIGALNFAGIANFLTDEGVDIVVNNHMQSLLYYHLHHLKKIQIYPDFDNFKDVGQTVKLLLIDI